jgi:hypothetical protein
MLIYLDTFVSAMVVSDQGHARYLIYVFLATFPDPSLPLDIGISLIKIFPAKNSNQNKDFVLY